MDVAAGIARVGARLLAGRGLERRREEQRLAIARRPGDDPVDRRLEAHVEHPVGLVDDRGSGRARGSARRRWSRSSSRPGVATTMCGPARRAWPAFRSRPRRRPGRSSSPRAGATSRSSSTICVASSRVGASTSAAGLRSLGSSRSAIGRPKARVLPEPVGDWTRTSRPARTSAMTSFWTANGATMPRFLSASVTGRETPRSAKDMLCNSLTSGGNPETRTHSECTEGRNSSAAPVATTDHGSREVGKTRVERMGASSRRVDPRRVHSLNTPAGPLPPPPPFSTPGSTRGGERGIAMRGLAGAAAGDEGSAVDTAPDEIARSLERCGSASRGSDPSRRRSRSTGTPSNA